MIGIGGMLASSVVNRVASKLGDLAVEDATLLWRFKDDVDDMKEKMIDLEAVMQDADNKVRQGGKDGTATRRWLAKLKSVAYDIEDVLDELDAAHLIKNHQSKLKLFFSQNNQFLWKMTVAHNMKNLREKIDKIEKESQKLNLVRHEPWVSRYNETFAAINKELANRRYLIILDDLWEEYGETLENLKKMLQHGSKGSKIIVTTRNICVVQILCTGYIANERKICPVHESDYINLGVLSLDDCWRVMKRRIFGPDDDQSGLEEIGREIAERCGGLPLVANALGQVMSEHRNIEAWKDIREKKIILDFKAEHQQDTLERLMLSYYYMKLEFKRCFTYLAAFSKGFVMDSDRFIQQWSALGYIQSRHNGQRCINYLLGMSFLQISKSSLVQYKRRLLLQSNYPSLGSSDHQTLASGAHKYSNPRQPAQSPPATGRLLLPPHFRVVQKKKKKSNISNALSRLNIVHCESAIPSMSGIGAMIASSVANRVASRLSELVVEEASLLWRFKDDMDDMEENMRDLEAVIQDADGKARQGGEAERRWLNKLKSVAYDVEDVLDELDAAQLIKNHQPKLKLFLSRNNPLLRKMTIARNMKNLREKIVAIKNDSIKLHLVHHEPVTEGSRGNETFADDSDMDIGMLGRDAETKKIISLLLNTEAKEDISIIPIVGLGGLGKTTLAQAVFADERVNVFDMRIWVYVSKEFDLLKIGKAIIRGANRSINLDNCNLQFVKDNLKKELANRRYLIVLDDLWEEYGENLEKLKQMLQHGGKGSKIIATTRSGSVVQVLYTGYLANERKVCPVPEPDHISLGVLSTDDCWMVMKRRVFGPDDEEIGLEQIGRQIASRCGGLPLVANALGQIMSEHRSIEAWTDIRDRKIALDFKADHQQDTLERLMLSYYYMKREFKMCFTYLAAFSKGFVMHTDRLIQQWRALGYIEASDDGQRYFQVFVGPDDVFIKAETIQECLNLPGIAEHDVHKLENGECSSVVELGRLCCRALRVQHLENVECLEDAMKAKLRDMTELRKLILSWGLDGTQNVDNNKLVLENLLPPRTLEKFVLNGYTSKVFPNWMSGISSYLPYLTYVRLSNLATSCLPAFGQLPNLRFFSIVSAPNIRKIGKEIYGEGGIFKKLRAFWLEQMYNLEEFWTTQNGKDDEFLIPDLHILMVIECPRLSFLPYPPRSMYWRLDNCNEVLPERGFGSLASSILPFRMTISNCNFSPDRWRRLQHLATLEMFQVDGCSGLHTLPDVIQCFISLKELYLRSWEDLEILPEWLGQLISLEDITIINCPKLKSLPKSIQNLTALRELRLEGCEELEISPELFGHLTSLKVISIQGCPYLTDLPESMKNLTFLEEIWLGGFNSLPEWIGQFICLKEINIYDSPNMTSLPESIRNLTSLKELYILNCPRLVERCQGEDASNISHIPRIILDDEIFIPGQAVEGSKVQASSQALVAPITKDTKTGLHTLSISNKKYLLDLSGQLLWSPCSPSHPTVPCSSGECAAASGTHRYCNNGGRTCTARPTNPVTGERAVGDLTLVDIVANATDGKTPTSEVTVRGVVSSCAPGSLLRSFPAMAAGDAGLGRGGVSLPTQLYSKLSLKRQFAVCLPSTAAAPGVAFFGGGPYNLMPPTLFDASTVLSYTDLVRSPTNPSAYSIKLRGIAMNQEAVHLPPGALSRGGGVTLDTAAPYTVLRRDVYRPFVAAFSKATARIPRVPSVAPFKLCFNSSALGFTRVGYAVAPIDLMTSGGRNWTVFGSNSLAQVAGDTACLAFVDGGWAARSAVTVGAFQMENNFLLFDEAASRLGFTSSRVL
uniref:Peptidase A1 domain-containing protein n=1 Tax=Oryza meridionalis TaxID=40149 RepID=A0A0E0CCR1_9ORYZ